MPVERLQTVLNRSFVENLGSSSGVSSSSLAQAMRGGSQDALRTSLRAGAQLFAQSVQYLNGVQFTLNGSRAMLNDLGEITDEAIALADAASKTSSSAQSRSRADGEFRALGNRFRALIESAEVDEKNILDVDDLKEFFTGAGLDPASSDQVADLFADFVVPGVGGVSGEKDTLLASELIQGDRPVQLPQGVGNLKAEVAKIFDETDGLTTRQSALRVREDLLALQEQITSNIENIGKAEEFIGQNVALVRETGLGLLNISEEVGDIGEAEDVAAKLQRYLRTHARSALSQIGNLDSLRVAALTQAGDEN